MMRSCQMVVGVLAATSLMVVALLAQPQRSQEDRRPQLPSKTTLHGLAEENGGRFTDVLPSQSDMTVRGLDDLSGRSDLVVIGTVAQRECQLTTAGRRLQTVISVAVQDVIKGAIDPGARTISVSLPGGDHRFADGDVVSQYPAGYRPAHVGRTYLWFLRASDPTPASGVPRYSLVWQRERRPNSNWSTERTPSSRPPIHCRRGWSSTAGSTSPACCRTCAYSSDRAPRERLLRLLKAPRYAVQAMTT